MPSHGVGADMSPFAAAPLLPPLLPPGQTPGNDELIDPHRGLPHPIGSAVQAPVPNAAVPSSPPDNIVAVRRPGARGMTLTQLGFPGHVLPSTFPCTPNCRGKRETERKKRKRAAMSSNREGGRGEERRGQRVPGGPSTSTTLSVSGAATVGTGRRGASGRGLAEAP